MKRWRSPGVLKVRMETQKTTGQSEKKTSSPDDQKTIYIEYEKANL